MRFKKRIDLNELKSEYQPNSYISFNLPRGKLDLSTLSMYYTPQAVPANGERLAPCYGHATRSEACDVPWQWPCEAVRMTFART